jgi:hypothetical protein
LYGRLENRFVLEAVTVILCSSRQIGLDLLIYVSVVFQQFNGVEGELVTNIPLLV